MVFVQSGSILDLEVEGPGFDPQQGGSDFSFYFFLKWFFGFKR